MTKNILLVFTDKQISQHFEQNVFLPAGYRISSAENLPSLETVLHDGNPDVILTGDKIKGCNLTDLAKLLLDRNPPIPVVLFSEDKSEKQEIQALRLGFVDYLYPPIHPEEVLEAIERALEHRRRWEEAVRFEATRDTNTLQKRVNGMEAIQNIGRKVTASLDLDSVLTAVVDSAVELTGAEEGSLLLIDENSGELYMQASKNFQEDFARTFRLPVNDSIAGEVIRTGKPVLIDKETPQKIKTSYLVQTIIYVPLIVQKRVIGVLEVDNRQSKKPFSDYHITLVSALADYAAIAIENARLYTHTEFERSKLETILTNIEEGVIIVDTDGRIMLINSRARNAFGITEKNVSGKRISDVLLHQELLEIIHERKQSTNPSRVELVLQDGRVLNAQLTPIPDIGLVVTMQDITYLKELDRIKSDFVSTVSHDLRSPLTAILGYVELIDRVGSVNEQQREFIRRVQISVHSITSLINDLLDLGRIEAGFDARNEILPFAAIIHYSIDGLKSRAAEKSQQLKLDIPEKLPRVLGNPVRLRQMLSNLLSNAIKYTPSGGQILISARDEDGQIILSITDSGPGIPPSDQPYIFDKFYRASNVPPDTPGTGLGLAIVKSIVENHLGRIWVDSALGLGTTFTLVIPTTEKEL